jgi:DNA repair exonuclease SbcCD ATPase subunit
MEVEICNFRCWKKKTVKFQDKGLILISGGSGSGKSSILNSIFFAITGLGNKLVSYGEKKCSVKLSFEDGPVISIYRTKNPGRLLVSLRNDLNSLLEDEEGQKYIDSIYGNHFQQTSYMTQKMIHSFLSLSPAEKMSFLQKFVLDDTSIQNMKKKCKENISTLKQKLTEARSKFQVFENEKNILEKDTIIKNGLDIWSSDNNYNNEIINYAPETLKSLNLEYNNLRENNILYNKYSFQLNEYNKNLDEINDKITELENKEKNTKQNLENIDYKGNDYINFLENTKYKIQKQKELNTLNEKIESEETNLKQFIDEQTSFYENEKKTITEQYEIVCKIIKKVFDIEQVVNSIEKWKKEHRTIIEFLELLKMERRDFGTIEMDIVSEQNEIELLQNKIKGKQQEIMEYKLELKQQNQVYKCPKCCSDLCFDSPSDTEVRLNGKNTNQILKIYNKNKTVSNIQNVITQIQNEEKEISLELENHKNKLDELKTTNKEIEQYNNKLEKYKQQISRCDTVLLKFLEFNLNEIERTKSVEGKGSQIEQFINKKMEKLVKKTEEYTKLKTDIENINKKLMEIKSLNLSNPTILQKTKTINSLKNTSEKLRQEIYNIEKTFSEYTIDTIDTNKIDDIVKLQYQKKHEYDNLNSKLKEIEIELKKTRTKLQNINNQLAPIKEFLKLNKDNSEEIENVKRDMEKYTMIEEKHNIYLNYEKVNNQLKRIKNEIRIQNYLIETTSKDIVLQEIFLNKINEAEGISLTKCIDSVNYYINDYLEKFFQNDSIIVDIVPFKDTKKDIKPCINIRVCYKGEEVELTSLSGGEYDRVSLAIMLAFNHICKSDMILLDESIASLDSELTSDILEKLKENLTNKRVIVVAHQLSTGVFDQIVNTH